MIPIQFLELFRQRAIKIKSDSLISLKFAMARRSLNLEIYTRNTNLRKLYSTRGNAESNRERRLRRKIIVNVQRNVY